MDAPAPPAVYTTTTPRDPGVAVAIGVGTGLLTLGVGFPVGYLYADDPLRGLAVGGVGTAVMLGGVGAMSATYWSGFGQTALGPLGYAVPPLAILGYYGWATADLYQTTERRNRERRTFKGL